MTAPGCAGHGPAGEELRLLVLALLDRFEPRVRSVLAGLQVEAAEAARAAGTGAAERAGAGRAAGAGAGETAGAEGGPSGAERPVACEWCPLCSAIAVLRGDRPELAGRVAELGGGLLTALRALLEQPSSGDTGPPPNGARPTLRHTEVSRADGGGC